MSGHFGVPGIGGSLGECALCGQNFMAEILLGRNVTSFTMPGARGTLYGHEKCIKEFDGKTMLDLPAASQLRQLYERQQAQESPATGDAHE